MNNYLEEQFLQFEQDFIRCYVPKQKELDLYIQKKKGIEDSEWLYDSFFNKAHNIALKTEVSEFINECRDVWKYWKDKPVDRDKLLDEFVDVLHFATLEFNKQGISEKSFTSIVSKVYNVNNRKNGIEQISKLNEVDHYADILGISLSLVINYYGFIAEDIKIAYGNKNNENYSRQQNGW